MRQALFISIATVVAVCSTMGIEPPGPQKRLEAIGATNERVGVYSFARYDPAFYGEPRGKDYPALLLQRSIKVLTHETGHMFGLTHCIYFHCVMNGSNHLQESDRRPLHLCPVCLRKLQFSVGFDVVKRYEALARFYRQMGLEDEAAWVGRRLEKIRRSACN
jgi:archaemetzincin